MVAPKLVASRERPAFSMNSTAEVGNNMTGEIPFDGEIRRIQDVLDKIGDSGLAESVRVPTRGSAETTNGAALDAGFSRSVGRASHR